MKRFPGIDIPRIQWQQSKLEKKKEKKKSLVDGWYLASMYRPALGLCLSGSGDLENFWRAWELGEAQQEPRPHWPYHASGAVLDKMERKYLNNDPRIGGICDSTGGNL